jgi:Potential Queuosine, Q, salvage protein family
VLLTDQVRETCRSIAESARFVSIDFGRLETFSEPDRAPEPDFVEGSPADVADFVLTLDSINFGSGWFPTLRKRHGLSGYFTVASALADRWRSAEPWSPSELRALRAADVAAVLGQEPDHELMGLYAEALRDLGRFLVDRRALDVVAHAEGSAERFASTLAAGMPFFDDRGFWKRAQIAANDLALAGVAEFSDLDRLTIFADNLVPHVLRVDGVLRYDPALAARIDAGELLPPGEEEREIRGCAVHACELIAARTGMPPRVIDTALWNKGQAPSYKGVPRHRTRTVFY